MKRLRLYRTVLAAGSLLAMVFGFLSSSAGAAEPYNSAQLKYLFTGSEIDGGGGGCGGTGVSSGSSGGGPLNFVLRFQDSKSFSADIECGSGWHGWSEKGSGTWKIESNELCLTAPPDVQFWRSLSGENCWKIVRWKWGFAALDGKGNEDWTMTLEAHPKHSTREELYAALKEIYVPPVAEAAPSEAQRVAEAKRRAKEERKKKEEQQRTPTVTAKKSPEPSSEVQNENERLRKEIARLKKEKQRLAALEKKKPESDLIKKVRETKFYKYVGKGKITLSPKVKEKLKRFSSKSNTALFFVTKDGDRSYDTYCGDGSTWSPSDCSRWGDVYEVKKKCEQSKGEECFLYKIGFNAEGNEVGRFREKVVWDFWYKSEAQQVAEAKRKAKEEAQRVAEAEQKLASKPASTPLPQPKPSPPTAKARDTTPPTIRISSAITVKTDSPTIKGRALDNTQVAQVTVEGVAVGLKPDGSFTFSRYVPLGGTQVTIEAVDEWGNKAQKVVRLSRKAVQTAALSFAPLNPTTIKGRRNDNAIALIIGVANYSRAPAATYADNDANVFGDYAHRALGVPRSNIKVLVNDKATLTDLRVSVERWLRGRIEEGKTDVHVFFAGHGLASPDGKDLYLLPYDGETSLLGGTALLRRELFEVIGKAKPKSATIFLDTCYSGLSRGKETLLASARGIVVTPKPQSIPSGFTVLSAASGQQISSGLDEAKHGLFSYYLMKGMEGGADANKDRKITAGELHAYLGSRVKRQAIRLGREQTPELSGDGERVLVRW